MIKIKDPKECCGCTACASICAHDAITMEPDALGFLYPKVDESKCVDCGLCDKVCQFKDNYDRSLNLEQPIAYAARHKDINEVMKSRSGAAFVAISDYILEQGGVVYGAGYKDHFRVAHKRATTKEERDEFRGSKYVQSDLTGVFRQVKEDLKNGLTVLFSGTPCQTAGLNAYVGKRLRENLILVDIVCHSVPSPYIWRDYVDYMESKCKKKIAHVDFRDKSYGWNGPQMERFDFIDGKSKTDFCHRHFFAKNLGIRRSCSVCVFCNMTRPSDITIGDFWGIEKVDPLFNADNKGVSLVIINTNKGQTLMTAFKIELNLLNVDISQALQPNLVSPTPENPFRQKFEDDYCEKGYHYILTRYGNLGWRYKGKNLLKRINRVFRKMTKIRYS
jgi:coenzyme F420-reducing hydrogenase beta subunit